MTVHISISFKDTIISKDCKEKPWLSIFFGESKTFFTWRRRSLKNTWHRYHKRHCFYNALWLMSIKISSWEPKIKHISVQKITKKQFWVSSTGYISSECWVLFSILHKQCVIKEDQLSGGRSMKRTRYSITQTCRKTNTDRPLIIVKWFLVFPIYQYKRVAVH